MEWSNSTLKKVISAQAYKLQSYASTLNVFETYANPVSWVNLQTLWYNISKAFDILCLSI